MVRRRISVLEVNSSKMHPVSEKLEDPSKIVAATLIDWRASYAQCRPHVNRSQSFVQFIWLKHRGVVRHLYRFFNAQTIQKANSRLEARKRDLEI